MVTENNHVTSVTIRTWRPETKRCCSMSLQNKIQALHFILLGKNPLLYVVDILLKNCRCYISGNWRDDYSIFSGNYLFRRRDCVTTDVVRETVRSPSIFIPGDLLGGKGWGVTYDREVQHIFGLPFLDLYSTWNLSNLSGRGGDHLKITCDLFFDLYRCKTLNFSISIYLYYTALVSVEKALKI